MRERIAIRRATIDPVGTPVVLAVSESPAIRTENMHEDEFINGHSLIRQLLAGQPSVTIPIVDGEVLLGRLDFSQTARRVVPSQTQPVMSLGTIKEPFLFAAVVHSTFTFMFSRIPPRLEEGLGVGDR